jgi:ABC-type transport system involved in multi-copper enzyme maturation permease subunit
MKRRLAEFMTRAAAQPWRVWTAQTLYLAKMELRKGFFRRRGLAAMFLAFGPMLLIFFHSLESPGGIGCSISEDTRILAAIFQFFYLRVGIFFGTMAIFTWLIRGEMVESTLHYLLLAPLRRELLVIGKFLAGIVTSIAIFGTGVLGSFTLMYLHFGPSGWEFFFQGPGQRHLASYLLVTCLACVGYGALFLALSLVFRNPALPGAILLGWESLSGLLPAALQTLTVTYYLKHLCPVSVPVSGIATLFTVVAEPVPPALAVAGLVLLAAAVLTFACFRIRRIEVSYQPE